jgi:tetratricopeptide (TPR) repeat protein
VTELDTTASETKNMPVDPKAIVAQIDSLNALGWTIRKTDARRALELSTKARRLAESETYDQGVAYSLRNMSESHYQIGDYKAGIADALEAVGLFEKLEDKHGLASALHSLAKSIGSSGDYSEAIQSYSKSLALFEPWYPRSRGAQYFRER